MPTSRLVRRAWNASLTARRLWLRGDGVVCPCCARSFRRFATYRGRRNAQCPACGSLERHRLAYTTVTALDVSGPVLHVAPDPILRGKLGARTVTMDLYRSADVRADLTRLPFRSGSVALVVCSHVLEHVPDDRGALTEIERVVAADGHALVIVPVDYDRATTYEDASITSPADRAKAFGQDDHVRIYGRDVRERISGELVAEELEDGVFLCRPPVETR